MAVKLAEQLDMRGREPQSMEELVLFKLRAHPLLSRSQIASGPDGKYGMAAYDEALNKLIDSGIVGSIRVFSGRKFSTATMYYLKAEEEFIFGYLQRNGSRVVESK